MTREKETKKRYKKGGGEGVKWGEKKNLQTHKIYSCYSSCNSVLVFCWYSGKICFSIVGFLQFYTVRPSRFLLIGRDESLEHELGARDNFCDNATTLQGPKFVNCRHFAQNYLKCAKINLKGQCHENFFLS